VVEDGGHAIETIMVDDRRIKQVYSLAEGRRLIDRNRIIALYKRIHAAGFVHNDVELRHIIWKGDLQSIKIIDFDESQTRDNGMNDDMWESWCRDEIQQVAQLLERAASHV